MCTVCSILELVDSISKDGPTLPYNTLQNAQKLSPGKVMSIMYPIALIFVRFPTNQDQDCLCKLLYKS